jgi:hypothetical protein
VRGSLLDRLYNDSWVVEGDIGFEPEPVRALFVLSLHPGRSPRSVTIGKTREEDMKSIEPGYETAASLTWSEVELILPIFSWKAGGAQGRPQSSADHQSLESCFIKGRKAWEAVV